MKNQFLDFGKVAPVVVVVSMMFVFMLMRTAVRVAVGMGMGMFMRIVIVPVFMAMAMVMAEMDIKFDSADLRLLGAGGVQMPAFEAQFFQLGLQPFGFNAEVDESADKHVAADAAEDIEIQGFHLLCKLSQPIHIISST